MDLNIRKMTNHPPFPGDLITKIVLIFNIKFLINSKYTCKWKHFTVASPTPAASLTAIIYPNYLSCKLFDHIDKL